MEVDSDFVAGEKIMINQQGNCEEKMRKEMLATRHDNHFHKSNKKTFQFISLFNSWRGRKSST